MTTILEQYREQRRKLVDAYIQPTRITFSPNGFTKMRAEHDSTALWNTAGPSGVPDTYDGWPYSVVNDQQEEVKLHNAMTDSRPRQNAVTVQLSFDAAKGQCLADGEPVGDPITTAQIIGSALTAAQLCDIIRAWLDSDDATHWGKFEHALDKVLMEHGTFE